MTKLFSLIALFCCSFGILKAQEKGYFGKKNIFSVQGSWFFRAVPQVFFKEPMYHYRSRTESFEESFWFNHVWNIGASYKHVISDRRAWGLQFDFGMRNLASPNFNLSSSKTLISPWNHSVSSDAVWSENAGKFVNLSQLEISKTNFNNKQFLFTWSRAKTATVFPLGLISTIGFGVQHSSLNFARGIFAQSLTSNNLNSTWSNEKELFQVNNPVDFKNEYLGIVWMLDLSLNYAINRRTLFSIGSDLRGVFSVFQLTQHSDIEAAFPNSFQDIPSLEALIFGRNMRKEIAKEMRFQNTIKVGLNWVF